MKTDITFDEWKKALEDLSGDRLDAVPNGWVNPYTLAEQIDRSPTHARSLLNKLCEAGRAEKRKFRVRSGDVVRPVAHYKLKK